MTLSVRVDGDERLISMARSAARHTADALLSLRASIEVMIKEELELVFRTAMASAGEGFPPIYQQHTLQTLAYLPIFIDVTGYGVDTFLDLEELGDYEAFEQGFHYHAQITGGGNVDLPYGGEDLKNSTEERYQYWLALLYGSDIPGYPPVQGKLAETYAARVSYWEAIGKAPEWLMLQYGEATSEPTVRPYPIIETLESSVYQRIANLMELALDTAHKETFQEYYEPEYTYTPIKSTGLAAIRDIKTGRFAGSTRL